MNAAWRLEVDLTNDPVWAAACDAPPCTEPLPQEELAAFEEAIEEYQAGRAPLMGEATAGSRASRPG